jgi:hypothetical protein
MKTPLLLCILALLVFAGSTQAEARLPSSLEADSLGLPNRALFQTSCRVTGVNAGEDSLVVEFTGRWHSTSNATFADTDSNAMSITRGKSISAAAWKALVERFRACRGKPVTLVIYVDGYMMRGGIPLFTYPQDRFEIVPPGQEFHIPIGYHF